MSKELDQARANAEYAVRILCNVASLPQAVGDQVRWPHNGCVWKRFGDDDWRSTTANQTESRSYKSDHVASIAWEHLSRGDALKGEDDGRE